MINVCNSACDFCGFARLGQREIAFAAAKAVEGAILGSKSPGVWRMSDEDRSKL